MKNKNARDWEKRKKKIFRVKKEELCTLYSIRARGIGKN